MLPDDPPGPRETSRVWEAPVRASKPRRPKLNKRDYDTWLSVGSISHLRPIGPRTAPPGQRMRLRYVLPGAIALLFATGVAAISQEPDQPSIRANVSVVLVPVTVTERKGRFVDGLRAEEFALTDNG